MTIQYSLHLCCSDSSLLTMALRQEYAGERVARRQQISRTKVLPNKTMKGKHPHSIKVILGFPVRFSASSKKPFDWSIVHKLIYFLLNGN